MIDIARITQPQLAELEKIDAAGSNGVPTGSYSDGRRGLRMQLIALGMVEQKPKPDYTGSCYHLTTNGKNVLATIRGLPQ